MVGQTIRLTVTYSLTVSCFRLLDIYAVYKIATLNSFQGTLQSINQAGKYNSYSYYDCISRYLYICLQ